MENAYHRQVRQQKMASNEKYSRFFTSLKKRVLSILKPPDSDQAYLFSSGTLDNNPILISSMYLLLEAVGANIQNTRLRHIVARELLKWLTKERPDVIFQVLQEDDDI